MHVGNHRQRARTRRDPAGAQGDSPSTAGPSGDWSRGGAPQFFIRNAAKFAELINTITSAVSDILAGSIGALASKVEGVLARGIPVVLDFLASMIGFGSKIVEMIKSALDAIRAPIQKAIDALLMAIKKALAGFIAKLKGAFGGKKKPLTPGQVVDQASADLSAPSKAKEPSQALAEAESRKAAALSEYQPRLPKGKTLTITFDKSIDGAKKDEDVDFVVSVNPSKKPAMPWNTFDEAAARARLSRAQSLKAFNTSNGFTKDQYVNQFQSLTRPTLLKDLRLGLKEGLLESIENSKYFFAALGDDELVTRGQAEFAREAPNNSSFGTQFGVPAILRFLQGRRIQGVPPDTWNRDLAGKVASAAVSAKVIEVGSKPNLYVLAQIPPKRGVPAAIDIRGSWYIRGSGFSTRRTQIFSSVLASTIKPLVNRQVANHEQARDIGLTFTQATKRADIKWRKSVGDKTNFLQPWEELKNYRHSSGSNNIPLFQDSATFPTRNPQSLFQQKGNYDVDHDPALATHWTKGGNNSSESNRQAAAGGEGSTQLRLISASINRGLTSDRFTPRNVGPDFQASGATRTEAAPGIPWSKPV